MAPRAGSLFAVVIAVLTALAGAAFAQTAITIGATPTSEPASAMVGVAEGFFEKQGLNATYTLISINPSIPPALLSNSLQIGVPTPTTYLQAIDGGLDLVVVAGVSQTSHKSGRNHIVVRKDSGITEPKDLVGKKFAVPGLNAVFHVNVRHWLTLQGIDWRKVNFVEAVFPMHGDMLRAGQVDAVVTAEPFLSNILNRGDGVTLVNMTEQFPEGNSTMMYVTTRDYAAKNKKVIDAFRAGIEDAKSFIAANPDKAREDIGRTMKMPPAAVANITIPVVDTKVTKEQLAFWIDVMNKQNMLTREIDPAKLIVE